VERTKREQGWVNERAGSEKMSDGKTEVVAGKGKSGSGEGRRGRWINEVR
jgi:hypothetical protein